MNINKTQLELLQVLNDNLTQARNYMSKIANKPANANLKMLAREMAKFIAYKSLGINPILVDNSADLSVNQFVQATSNLTDFRRFKGVPALEPLMSNIPLLKAVFGLYFTTRIQQMQSPSTLFAYDGEPEDRGFFGNLLAKLKEVASGVKDKAVQSGKDKLYEKGGDAADNLLTWLSEETGIGRAEGNTANSGPKIYFVWKYFPNNPNNSLSAPILEPTSKNWFEKNWKPVIENESGLAFATVQNGFLKYFTKIKAGYFKDQQAFYAQLKEDIKKENEKVLTHNPILSIFKKLFK